MPNRKMFPDSVVPLPTSPGVTPQGMIINAAQPHHCSEKMELGFHLGLSPALEKELEDRAASGEVISPDEMRTKYSADAATAGALEAWLKNEGFTIMEMSSDHTTIYASAPVSQVEASLGVHMVSVT